MSDSTDTSEPIVITRDLDLDVSTDELWRMVSDGDRWAEWLTDEASVVVEPARTGSVVDEDGVVRRVDIHSVVPGERVRFAWWPTDRPDESSMVELVVTPIPSPDGRRSRLSVIETYATASSTPSTMTSSSAWDLRIMMLVLCLDAVALSRT